MNQHSLDLIEQGCILAPSVSPSSFYSPYLSPVRASSLPVAHKFINHPDSLFISLSEAAPCALNIQRQAV